MKHIFSLIITLLTITKLYGAATTYTVSYASTVDVNCSVGDTLKFYGNANDHYIVNINATTIINSTAVPSGPYYIGRHVVTSTDTSYTIGRMSQGMRSGKITVSSATGISQSTMNVMSGVFPNPTTGICRLISSGNEEAEIYSTDSKTVFKTVILKGENTIDLSGLPAGIYFLRVGNTNRKIIRE